MNSMALESRTVKQESSETNHYSIVSGISELLSKIIELVWNLSKEIKNLIVQS